MHSKEVLHSHSQIQEAFYSGEVGNLRTEIRKFETELSHQNDINILVIGPSALAKNALIKTFVAAYHNNSETLAQKSIVQGGWVSKTALTHHQKYIIEGSTNQLQRKNINFLEYCQTVNSKTITNFSKMFRSIMPNILTPQCGSMLQTTLLPNNRTTVFCFESGVPLTQDEYCYLGLLVSNIQEQKIEPIVIIVNMHQPVKWPNERSAIERKESQIRKFSNGFNIPRNQVYLLQCYKQEASLSNQINYYALQVLLSVLRQSNKPEKQVRQRARVSSCF